VLRSSSNAGVVFAEAVEQHQKDLYAFAYRLLGQRSDAEDALQEAFVKALRAVGSRQVAAAPPRAWLFRAVYHCCIDERRRQKRTTHDVLDESVIVAAPEPEAELVRELSAALLALPVPTRAAVLLVDVHGLTYVEAAGALELPRGTVASRLNHGRDALRAALAAHAPQNKERIQ
jgi:RNA polymerase sigma-70 factor (ECF subfamily)